MRETAHGKNKSARFSFRRGTKTSYFITLAALLAVGVIGYLLTPTGGAVSARTDDHAARNLNRISELLSCAYSLSSTGTFFPIGGGNGSFNVTSSETTCSWTAASNVSWITITSGGSGTGNGTVTFTVAANPGGQRIGQISAGGRTFVVEQAGTCLLSLSSNGASFSAAGGSGQFGAFHSGCSPLPVPIAATQTPWITINSKTFAGYLTVTYNVQPNYGPQRTGTITVFGSKTQSFTITQESGLPNRRTQFDFDGDGIADVSVFRASSGTWYLNRSQAGFFAAQWGAPTDQIVPGDYDGDGVTDLAVFRKNADSTWYILNSATNTFRAARWGATNLEQQLLLSDRAAPGDYDGDGKTDLAVWRLTDFLSEPARFVILQSSNNTGTSRQWGAFGDSPTPAADYDGDGRTDLTVRRGSTWYILPSQTSEPRAVQFGLASDKAVPADYDGDGKADVAVFRNGTWYLQRSRDGFLGFQFGLGSDLPVPADYDGDGKTDIAVFRDGTWYLQRSQAGFTGIAFGAATDKPVPNAFIP